jgi:PAS domain S-box-containing protein
MEKEKRSTSNNYNDTLVVELDKFGEIIQFNKGCQKILGYSKEEVLHKKMWDFLIPEDYTNQWKEMFKAAIQNEEIKNLKIPLKTCHGEEVLISWSSVPLENKEGLIKNICFIGITISGNVTGEKVEIKNQDTEQFIDNSKEIKMVVKSEKITSSNKKTLKEEPEKNLNNVTPIENSDNEEIIEGTPIKSEKMEDIISDLSDNYNKLNKRIIEMDKKSKDLDENLKIFKENNQEKNVEYQIEETSIKEKENRNTIKKWSSLLKNPFKDRKSQIEDKNSITDLEKRQEELDRFEAELIRDKKNLEKKIVEFTQWKEKLIKLESEIERRRIDLIEKESTITGNLTTINPNQFESNNQDSTSDILIHKEKFIQNDHHDIFDKIPKSAVILQRGILKQVNHPFVELLGYDMNDVLGKSLFDFISPEGFSALEKHFLDRLKGVGSAGYNAVFLTKENHKLTLEVNIKPTIFNGEKAEIAIFNNITDVDDKISDVEHSSEKAPQDNETYEESGESDTHNKNEEIKEKQTSEKTSTEHELQNNDQTIEESGSNDQKNNDTQDENSQEPELSEKNSNNNEQYQKNDTDKKIDVNTKSVELKESKEESDDN